MGNEWRQPQQQQQVDDEESKINYNISVKAKNKREVTRGKYQTEVAAFCMLVGTDTSCCVAVRCMYMG